LNHSTAPGSRSATEHSGALHSTRAQPRRPRVLFLNRSYWPDVEATGQLLTELCEDLAGSIDVTVLAGQPNQNPEQQHYRPAGLDHRNGVTIRRVWNTRFSKRSFIGKAVNLLTYSVSAWAAALRLPRPDIIVAETDPPWLCLLGAFLRHWFGCALVVYLQDVYPDVAVAVGALRPGRSTILLRRLFFNVHRRADRVVVISDEMRQLLIDAGVAVDRIVTIPNWVDTRRVQPWTGANRIREEHAGDARLVVMYSGNVGLCQRLEDVIEAAARLADRDDIRFLIVGEGVKKSELLRQASQGGLKNIVFLPYQPKHRLAESLGAADVQIVPLDERVTGFLMPSKLYGVLASARPLLAVAPASSDLAQIAQRYNCGVVVPPANPAALAEAIAWCADHRAELIEMGSRGRALAVEQYDRALVTRRFGELIAALSGAPPAASSSDLPLESSCGNTSTANGDSVPGAFASQANGVHAEETVHELC
jgi:glycosyltransferase involved in cell wall biosynthesis